MCDIKIEYIRDFLLILAGGVIGLFSNLVIEIYRNRSANKDAYEAIKAEIESNIESAHRAELSERLWSNSVYKANLNRLKNFKINIKKVVKFYFKIENYKDRYLQLVQITDDLKKTQSNYFLISRTEGTSAATEKKSAELPTLREEIGMLKSQVKTEMSVLLLLAKEIEELGKEIIN
jgi:hypothetical protein